MFNLKFVAEENGPFEIVHDLLTALATVLFYLSWRNGKGAVRIAGGALALLASAAFVRELDVEQLSKWLGWDWLVWVGEHGLQEVLLIAMTLPIFAYLFKHRARALELLRLALRWQAWPLYVSGALLVLTVYMDAEIVRGMEMRFWEEVLETYGYVFMVIAAWRHLHLVGDPVWDRDAVSGAKPGRLSA